MNWYYRVLHRMIFMLDAILGLIGLCRRHYYDQAIEWYLELESWANDQIAYEKYLAHRLCNAQSTISMLTLALEDGTPLEDDEWVDIDDALQPA